MRSQVKQADRVLLVFTETYQRRFEGDEEEGTGLGATFEGVIVTQALYERGSNAKFRPVVFTEEDAQFIPLELRRFNHYRVDTPDHYQNLLRWLHEAPRNVPPPVGPKPPLPPVPPSPQKSVERNRRDLLNDVEGEVQNRLEQSLHSAVLINLLKEKQPQQVRRPWDLEVKGGQQPNSPVPPGTQIIDIFDQNKGRLLVLGAPGAGKTTTLLQLAKELIARAQTDSGAPMPVLLNLSSWKDDGQPLVRWLEAELKSKYGVRKDIGRRWLHDRCLLPLLDGLDELEPTRQEQCVHAINQFQNDYDYRPDHLVVCCRLAEYQNCNTKLRLKGAIYLHPLTDEQVCNYLASANHPELWNHIQTDAELLALARSPLLLSMLTLAYETRSIQYAAYVGLVAGQVGGSIYYLSLIKFPFSDALPVWSRVGQIAGVISGPIASVAILLITRPSVWLNRGLRDWVAIRWADSLISALMWGIGAGLILGLDVGILSGLGMGIIAGLSHGLSNRPPFRMADALMVGLIGGVISKLVTWIIDAMLFKVVRMGLIAWMGPPLYGWVGAGATAGFIACPIAKQRKTIQPVETLPKDGMAAWNWLALRWRQWLIGGVVAASVPSVLMGWGQKRVIQGIYVLYVFFGFGVIFTLTIMWFIALMAALLGALVGASVGALLGSLSVGLTGPELRDEQSLIRGFGSPQAMFGFLLWWVASLWGQSGGS
jgi:hypothetical protein